MAPPNGRSLIDTPAPVNPPLLPDPGRRPAAGVFRFPENQKMPQLTVTAGLYRFFTLAQLNQERLRYIAEVQKSNTQLTGASINGQSFQFQVGGREITLEQWGDALAAAYVSLGVTDYGFPTPTRSTLRF